MLPVSGWSTKARTNHMAGRSETSTLLSYKREETGEDWQFSEPLPHSLTSSNLFSAKILFLQILPSMSLYPYPAYPEGLGEWSLEEGAGR